MTLAKKGAAETSETRGNLPKTGLDALTANARWARVMALNLCSAVGGACLARGRLLLRGIDVEVDCRVEMAVDCRVEMAEGFGFAPSACGDSAPKSEGPVQ